MVVQMIKFKVEQLIDEAYNKGYEARKAEESKSAEMIVTGDKNLLEREYQRGLDDAWECARKMEYMLFNQPQFNDCFGATDFYSVLTKITVSKAKEKIREYEESKKEAEKEEKRNSCEGCSHLDTGTAEYCNGYGCKDYDKYEPKQTDEIKIGDEKQRQKERVVKREQKIVDAVLDRIRAEISDLAPDDPDDEYYEGEAHGIAMAIRVIDKHRKKVRNKDE